jgi:hypothetical protein
VRIVRTFKPFPEPTLLPSDTVLRFDGQTPDWTCGLWVGNQIGVASFVEFLGIAEVEQRTKPSSLDGCPMFAPAYMGRR